jgi:hypothetical protein
MTISTKSINTVKDQFYTEFQYRLWYPLWLSIYDPAYNPIRINLHHPVYNSTWNIASNNVWFPAHLHLQHT